MADDRTTVTELATALGMTGHATLQEAIEARSSILKLEPDEWASLEGICSSGSWTSVAETAFGNGAYFASHVDGLNGRAAHRIEWSGGRRIPGDRPVPADLVVDRVYMVSCKYLSRILHNTAPAHVFIDGLAVTSQSRGINWFQEVAADAHEALYARTMEVLGLTDMAESPVSQTQEQRTKLRAAALAARSGTPTRIASGREPDVLGRLLAGESIGTLLEPGQAPLGARKQWLAGQLSVSGRLHIDEGAARVLVESGRSLLAVGVRGVEGEFSRGEVVACFDPSGAEVARGLVNYDAGETRRIMGQRSERIAELLGYVDEPELIHRDNLVLMLD